ncbi:hypothetical protein GcM3_057026 [Golovinomyces cichoracearum]|uniref:Uncharacterized protein n=1 Tax=Golovinomyces cichoracearum TaxID=62708 RepID=A0A420IXG9_9PEZI|nr:hypothetical protein GcM3_057026 [Golovinomyces cichoracearum]
MTLKLKLIAEPVAIWERFKTDFADSAVTQELATSHHFYPVTLSEPEQDYILWKVQLALEEDQRNTVPDADEIYDVEEQAEKAIERISTLNPDQTFVFNTLMDAFNSNPSSAHFNLQGPSGSGKTYTHETICFA